MTKIQRISRILQILLILTLTFIPVLFIYNNFITRIHFFTSPVTHGFITVILNQHLPKISCVLNFFQTLIQMVMIFCLIKLFGLYANGLVFEAGNTKYIQRVGICLVAKEIFNPIMQGVMMYFVTKHNAVIKHQISISLTPDQLHNLLMGIMIILVSWVMYEAAKIKQDNDSII